MMLSNNIIKKNSEEEPLIAHLDLKLEDLEMSEIDDSSEQNEDNIFIKDTIKQELDNNKSELS